MRNVLVLTVAQFFGACGQVLTVLLTGVLGALLAPDRQLATVPLTVATLSIALTTVPMGMLLARYGRRRVFIVAAFLPAAGSLLAAWAITSHDFILFCVAAGIMGTQLAFQAQYRFAAAESVAGHQVPRAVANIMLGTVAATLIAPWLVVGLRNSVGAEYVGSYLVLALLYLLGGAVLLRYQEPVAPVAAAAEAPTRSAGELWRDPQIRLAILCAAAAYGTMSLIMTATPLSMHLNDGHSMEATTFVLQSHSLAMYAPSLVSGLLVQRLGIARLLLAGLVIEATCVLISGLGHSVMHYWAGLVALGLGWNLLFVAATTLLTRSYRPAERYRAQTLNDFVMFGVMGSVSLLAGFLMQAVGWVVLNQLAVIPLALLALVLWRRRAPA
jgi:MFS family permease